MMTRQFAWKLNQSVHGTVVFHPTGVDLASRLLRPLHCMLARPAAGGGHKPSCDRARGSARVLTVQDEKPDDRCLSQQVLSITPAASSASLDVTGLTPMAALDKLNVLLQRPERSATWVQEAKIVAVMGSCPRSHSSFKSGINNWLRFAEVALGGRVNAFPPTLDAVLAWSTTHRCAGTFSNYLGHLRAACIVLGCVAPDVQDPAIKRAKVAIVKRMVFTSRPKMFIQRDIITNMVLAVNRGWESRNLAMLWLASYTFLLRVPSEALPMMKAGTAQDACEQSVLSFEGDTLCLRLKRRKNLQGGSVLKRTCQCSSCPILCPVHVLWNYFCTLKAGEKPWAAFSERFVLSRLRTLLAKLEIVSPQLYGTHDFRRGHAKDLQKSGVPLAKILAAGQWRSAAFMHYLDELDLEQDVVLEAALASDESYVYLD